MKLSSASGAVVVGVIIVVAATVIVGFSARSGTTYPVALSGRGLPRSDASLRRPRGLAGRRDSPGKPGRESPHAHRTGGMVERGDGPVEAIFGQP